MFTHNRIPHNIRSTTAPVALCILMTLAPGCAKDNKKPEKTEKSNTQVLLEGFTGKSAVDRGKQAEATIRKISKQKNEDLKEIMGE